MIWNFMMGYRELIIERLTWNLGDGKDALFWDDSWGGFEVLSRSYNLDISKRVLESS